MTPPTPARGTRIWQIAFGVVLSAVLLWWSFRGTSPAEVLDHLRHARLLPILLGVALATLTFVLRTLRWRLLLRAEDGSALPTRALWHATAMGFMANNVLPLRAGEVVRVFAASRLTGARFTSALASVAVDRLFDALTVVCLLGVGLLGADLPPNTRVAGVPIHRIVAGGGLVVLAGLAVAAMVLAWPVAAERAIRALCPAGRLAERLVGMIEGIRHGLSALRSPVRIVGVIAWSLTTWLVNALSFYVMFGSLGIVVGFPGTLLLQSLIMVGISVPSTPGYIGAFEAPIKLVLDLYSVPADLAATYAITYHSTTYLPITLLGLWSLYRTGLGLREIRRVEG